MMKLNTRQTLEVLNAQEIDPHDLADVLFTTATTIKGVSVSQEEGIEVLFAGTDFVLGDSTSTVRLAMIFRIMSMLTLLREGGDLGWYAARTEEGGILIGREVIAAAARCRLWPDPKYPARFDEGEFQREMLKVSRPAGNA
jgi:hypothetical protein